MGRRGWWLEESEYKLISGCWEFSIAGAKTCPDRVEEEQYMGQVLV